MDAGFGMTEDRPDPNEERPPEEPAAAAHVPPERTFLRLAFWQTVLSIAGVFIAVVALYAALTESAAVRQQTAAAVWPYVQFMVQDSDTGESADLSISFTNSGVGPARMRTLQVVIDGEPLRDWAHAVELIGGQVDDHVSRNFISGRVLSPDEAIVAFHTTEPALARGFQAAVANPRSYVAYCYCSIFDECWLSDSRQGQQDPEAVDACPDFGAHTFRN